MKAEDSIEERAAKPSGSGPNENAADDLRFMRSVVERSDRQVRPEGHVLTACGLICLICYTAVHFLVRSDLQKWILPVYLPLMAVLLGYTFYALAHGAKRQKREGYIILGIATGAGCIVPETICRWKFNKEEQANAQA